MDPVAKILQMMEKHHIEIISYGLAPNPFGFCFEAENVDSKILEEFSALLDSLNNEEINQLKRKCFNG